MTIETDITKLVFNKMSQEKYEELKAKGELVNNEFYITPDSNIDIDIPENVVEADNYVNAKLWKGTLAEYEALESYDDSVTYIITDDVVEGGTIVSVDAYTKSETNEFLNAKQDVLVSGTNIKTINGESILGEGDYVIDVDTSEIENNINTLNNELTTVKTDLNNKLDTTQITNCITEIPQDIKLELVDGTLTLKAGSKVYVPNGFEADGTTPKFDEVVLENDFNVSNGGASGNKFAFWRSEAKSWAGIRKDLCYSSATEPETGKYQIWYDITNNSIYRDFEFTGEWIRDDKISLPFASFTTGNESVISSIDQVFNGFGYIGSTVFVLPNVKGLIPNGRNADGSLKNIEVTTSKVFIHDTYIGVKSILHLTQQGTITATPQTTYINQTTRPTFQKSACWEDTTNNIIWKTIASSTYWEDGNRKVLNFGKANYSDGKITELTINLSFRAVDYSDSSTVSGWAMPSGKYINLTIGATGSTYTAPANGLFYARGTWHSESAGIYIYDNSYCDYAQTGFQGAAEGYVNHWVKKGTEVTIKYDNATITEFKFVYAEGEN